MDSRTGRGDGPNASGIELAADERERMLRRVHSVIGRYALQLRAVGATLPTLDDAWWLCTVALRPRRRAPLIVQGCDATLRGAATRVLERAEREYRRTRRRRTHTGRSAPGPLAVT